MSHPGDVMVGTSSNQKGGASPSGLVAGDFGSHESSRGSASWLDGGGWFPGGLVGWKMCIFFLTNLAIDEFLFCVFFFFCFLWNLCHGWQSLFFFVIYVFCWVFPFTVRMGNFCVSHFVRLDLSWRWDVFLLFWSCWITFLMSMKMFRKTVLIFPFFFWGEKRSLEHLRFRCVWTKRNIPIAKWCEFANLTRWASELGKKCIHFGRFFFWGVNENIFPGGKEEVRGWRSSFFLKWQGEGRGWIDLKKHPKDSQWFITKIYIV